MMGSFRLSNPVALLCKRVLLSRGRLRHSAFVAVHFAPAPVNGKQPSTFYQFAYHDAKIVLFLTACGQCHGVSLEPLEEALKVVYSNTDMRLLYRGPINDQAACCVQHDLTTHLTSTGQQTMASLGVFCLHFGL